MSLKVREKRPASIFGKADSGLEIRGVKDSVP